MTPEERELHRIMFKREGFTDEATRIGIEACAFAQDGGRDAFLVGLKIMHETFGGIDNDALDGLVAGMWSSGYEAGMKYARENPTTTTPVMKLDIPKPKKKEKK